MVWRCIQVFDVGIRERYATKQELDLYSDPGFLEALEIWASDTAWPEIELLLRDRRGKVLDLACGTCRASDFLRGNKQVEYYGCDISQMLIERAVARGVSRERLRVGNAARLDYSDGKLGTICSRSVPWNISPQMS